MHPRKGRIDPIGNYEFITYVEDHDEPGNGVDRFWIQVLDKDRAEVDDMSTSEPATENTIEIQGGNLVVPHGGQTSELLLEKNLIIY